MGLEIERKFLVTNASWRALGEGVRLCQGYLSADPERIVRIRIEGEAAMLTIKGKNHSISRAEWEYPIPLADAQVMLQTLCQQPCIEKYRYRIQHQGLCWEVDEFLGANAGLIVAEVELESEDQVFAKPDWIGDEVSHDHRYANANLLKHPYCDWT